MKTRLIGALGPEGAASLHERLTRHTLSEVDRYTRDHPAEAEVHFAGGDEGKMCELYGKRRIYRPQGEGHLGDRLSRAADLAFAAGGKRLVIIGTDCPGLTAEVLTSAFESLGASDVVLGPAFDGGYYLIGLRSFAPALFENIPWGTEAVLDSTLAASRKLGLTVSLLPAAADIDRPEDLVLLSSWPELLGAGP